MGGTSMNIVLSILQVLGWSLLAIVLLVVLLLLILLFCPLRYLVEGDWQEEKWAKFKAHWLFHLLRAKISYGDDLIYGEVSILWKKINFSYDFTKKEEEENHEEYGDVFDIEDAIEDDVETEVEEFQEKVIGTETAAELRGEMSSDEINYDESNEHDDIESKDESINSKIKGIIERIQDVYARIKVILTDEDNQDAVKHIKDEVIYLIKIFLPKKSKVNAVFSTGSPDTTGQLFGILALFPVMYHKNWNLVPDFQSDDAYFKGTFWGKGWIAIYQFVGIVLRILFDKNCRKLYTKVNQFIKWMKNDDKSQEEK